MKELFIVEGKSAASTLSIASDNATQEIYPLQGKLINAQKASQADVFNNEECQNLIAKLGCGIADQCIASNLKFSRILILSDPDIDGTHISALLLSFFSQYLRPIVDNGLLYIIKAPTYKVTGGSDQSQFAWTEDELEAMRIAMPAARIVQMKSIASFTASECVCLLLNPERRRQYQLTL